MIFRLVGALSIPFPVASSARFPLLLGRLSASNRRSPRLQVTRVVSIRSRDGGFICSSPLLPAFGYFGSSALSVNPIPDRSGLDVKGLGPIEQV